MQLLSGPQRGALYAILSGIGYGLLGYFGMTIIHEHWSVSNMLFWRFLVATFFIGLLFVPKLKELGEDWRYMLKIVAYGMFLYGPTSMIYFVVSKSIGTGLAMVIFFTFPAFVILLNWLIDGKRVSNGYFCALALILLGMFFLVDVGGASFDLMGILLGLASALLYSFYIRASGKNKVSPYVSTLMVSIGCMLSALIVACVDHSLVIPMTWVLWKNIIGVGIICTALPILLMLEAFRYISSEKASILSVFEPICTVMCGILFLGEVLSPFQGIGIIAILVGVLITLLSSNAPE